MFEFIKSDNEDAKVTVEYIEGLEEKMQIKFPTILKEFYLKHNGAKIKECCFEIYETEFFIYSLCDLNYGRMPVEKILEKITSNEGIPNQCYPIAEDDINYYYWDTRDGKIYYYMIDDIEHPIIICNSVEEFFEILNSCYDKKITIKGSSENIPNPYLNSIDFSTVKKEENIDKEYVLKYNGKFTTYCIWALVVGLVISLLLMQFSKGLLTIIIFMCCSIYLPFFIVIDIVNRIKTNNALNKYNINEIKEELNKENVIKLDDIDTYLTDNYIISNSKYIKITKYDEIQWIYQERPVGRVVQQGMVTSAYKFGGTPLVAYLKDGKKVVVALVKNTEHINMIFGQILKKYNKALIGNTYENIKKYEKMSKKFKRKNNINTIIMYFTFIFIIILGIVYKIFY